MATSTVSHHVFRRNARKMERKLERERIQQLGEDNTKFWPGFEEKLQNTSYRVAKRNGGLRWAVEKVTR
jgi:hypothetical protein